MDTWKLPWAGGCRCGRVRMQLTQPPLLTNACHCTGCQRMTASAFSLSIAVPAAGFEVLHGEPVLGGVQDDTRHYHCPFCKSWLFTRIPGIDFMVNVRASVFDDHAWFVPFVETWTKEKLAWVQTPAVHRFESIPEMPEWQNLMADFAQRGPRP